MILLAVIKCKLEKVSKIVEVRRDQHRVLALAHRGDHFRSNVHAKLGQLGYSQLLIV